MSATTTALDQAAYRQRVRTGLYVAAGLAVLTVVEYLVAVSVSSPLLLLLPFVVAKGLLILDYYMHARQLWR